MHWQLLQQRSGDMRRNFPKGKKKKLTKEKKKEKKKKKKKKRKIGFLFGLCDDNSTYSWHRRRQSTIEIRHPNTRICNSL
jgi:hypothetical protein